MKALRNILTSGLATVLLGLNLWLPTDSSAQQRIIGGTTANAGDFPSIVSLTTPRPDGSLAHFCGGSLIDKRWVLTAAHCLPSSIGTIKVRVNSLDSTSGGEIVDVEGRYVHPDYSGTQLQNDIGLIRLSRDIVSVQPATLAGPDENSVLVPNTSMSVAGWGYTSNEVRVASRYLMKAAVPVVDQNICKANYSTAWGITIYDSMLCAGAWGIDSCSGDSGGPLVLNDSSGNYLSGIVSFGPSLCGSAQLPGVYTRVSSFIEWIRQVSGIGNLAKVSIVPQNPDTDDTSPTISWGAVANAEKYQISVRYVSDLNNTSNVNYLTTSTSITLPEGPQGWYTISVRAKWGPYYGEYSDSQELRIFKIPSASRVLSPTSGQRLYTFRPTISWAASTNAQYYNLSVRNLTTGTNYNQNNLAATSYTFRSDIRPGKYNVVITSVNGPRQVTSSWSSFSVSLALPVINPLQASYTIKRPTITWAAVPEATSYRIYFKNLTTGATQDIANLSSASYTSGVDMSSGLYDVWVLANNAAVSSAWSKAARFSIVFSAPTTITVAATGTRRPQISWSAVAGAPAYEVYIRNVANPSIVLRQTVTGTTYVPSIDLTAGNNDVWVKVVANGVVGTWSSAKRFAVN